MKLVDGYIPSKGVHASVNFLGGIDSPEKGVSLTGSATLLEIKSAIKNLKVLVDYGMFQGGINDNFYNTEIDKKALSADFLVLTHAHIDHVGRIPLLVKKGFTAPIFMTKETFLLIKLILEDSVKVQEEQAKKAENMREKTTNRWNRMLDFLAKYEKYEEKQNKENKQKLKISLEKDMTQLGFDSMSSIQETQKVVQDFLDLQNIQSRKDIEIKSPVKYDILYDREDVAAMLDQVKIVDFYDEVGLDNFSYISKISENTLSELIESYKVHSKNSIKISPKIFMTLKKQIAFEIQKTRELLQENKKISLKNEKLTKDLEFALEILIDKESMDYNFAKKYEDFLEKYNVKSKEDIENALEKPKNIKFVLEDLLGLDKLLQSEKISNDKKYKNFIEKVTLEFFKAGHIPGSAQAVIGIYTSKIGEAIGGKSGEKIKDSVKRFGFSGDIGRLEDYDENIGKADFIDKKLDYYQVESTYAERNHVNKSQCERELIEVIKNAPGKVVIPTFAMHRAQNILTLILTQASQEQELKNQIKEIKKQEKGEVDLEKSLELKKKKEQLASKLLSYKTYVLDSPLASELLKVYIKHFGPAYDILKPEIQEKIFGRQMIKVIKSTEARELLYSDSDNNEVIITSSGMCEGGPILAHLPKILKDKKATLVFVGYAPDSTRGGILKKGEAVLIEGNYYTPMCNIVDLKGFSSHIGHDEILDLLNHSKVNKKTKLILNHGGVRRSSLADDIGKNTKISSENIFIPGLGDTMHFRF